MNTSTSTAVTTTTAPTMPAAVMLRGRTGKNIGTIQHFTGSMGAKEVKEKLKASGLKGAELTARVNEVLRGEQSLREQLGVAWVQATIQAGFLPDAGKIGKNTASLRFVKLAAPKVEPTEDETLTAAAKVLGLTVEELKAMKAGK